MGTVINVIYTVCAMSQAVMVSTIFTIVSSSVILLNRSSNKGDFEMIREDESLINLRRMVCVVARKHGLTHSSALSSHDVFYIVYRRPRARPWGRGCMV